MEQIELFVVASFYALSCENMEDHEIFCVDHASVRFCSQKRTENVSPETQNKKKKSVIHQIVYANIVVAHTTTNFPYSHREIFGFSFLFRITKFKKELSKKRRISSKKHV